METLNGKILKAMIIVKQDIMNAEAMEIIKSFEEGKPYLSKR